MGMVTNITAENFPRQSDCVGSQVRVCFHFDTKKQLDGVIVRDDLEEPFVMLIKLEDDRYVLATECMYQLP